MKIYWGILSLLWLGLIVFMIHNAITYGQHTTFEAILRVSIVGIMDIFSVFVFFVSFGSAGTDEN